MNNNLLNGELGLIQEEYLAILKRLNKIEYEDIPLEIADAINIFWFEKRKIIKLICDYYFVEKDTYCITGAVHFDISKKDEYGFFMLGEYHVFDDPLPDYLMAASKVSDQVFLNSLYSVIAETIKQNIKLIEELQGKLYVLPLRHLSQIFNQDDNELSKLVDHFILQIFSDIKDVKTYKEKILTIDDVIGHLEPNNSSWILLFDGDHPSVDWKTRFNTFLENYNKFNYSNYSEGEIFYMTLYGYVRQALAIMVMEETFNVIPLIRSCIPLHYYTMLTITLESNASGKVELYKYNYTKSQLAYLVYIEYGKRNFNNSFSVLREKAKSINFERRLLEKIEVESNLGKISEIIKVINNLLKELENE